MTSTCIRRSVTQASVPVFKRSPARLLCLCNVAVLVCRGLAALDVLLVDEHLDALLDHADTWVEPGFGLIDDLQTETLVKQRYNSSSYVRNRKQDESVSV